MKDTVLVVISKFELSFFYTSDEIFSSFINVSIHTFTHVTVATVLSQTDVFEQFV